MDNIDLNAPITLAQAQRKAGEQLLAGQNLTTTDYLGRYGSTIAGQGTTSQAAERIGGELGLPQLRQNAFNLNQQVIDIPEVYKAGTRGFDVNQNQLSRIVNQKTSELAPLAQRATSQAQFAEGELGTRLGYLQNDWNRQLLPLDREQSFMLDNYARQGSLFSEANQSELNALLQKISNGITLSEGEKNRAQQLAIAEKGYENELKKISESAKYSSKAESPYQTVGEGSALYNTASNQMIFKNPKTYQASAGGSGW